MKQALLTCAVGLAIALKDTPSLLRKKSIKELAVYSLMLVLGVWVSILGANFERNATPLLLIEFIYRPVIQVLQHIFPS